MAELLVVVCSAIYGRTVLCFIMDWERLNKGGRRGVCPLPPHPPQLSQSILQFSSIQIYHSNISPQILAIFSTPVGGVKLIIQVPGLVRHITTPIKYQSCCQEVYFKKFTCCLAAQTAFFFDIETVKKGMVKWSVPSGYHVM